MTDAPTNADVLSEIKPLLAALLTKVDRVLETQTEHSTRLDRIEGVQTDHSNRLDRIENRLDGVENRLDRVEKRIDQVETGLKDVQRVSSVNHFKVIGRIDQVASMLAEHMADPHGSDRRCA